VTEAATTTELKSWRPKSQRPASSCVETTSMKLRSVTAVGIGDGDSEKPCDGDSAILMTHRTG
jgi:hypothetical protein